MERSFIINSTNVNRKVQEKNDKSKIQWHPAFYAGLQIEFNEEAHKLIFENEHNLSKKPMQIDVLIIKKRSFDVIHKNLGQIFRMYNIIEYKSPDDYISIDDFWKVYGYALFYKAESAFNDAIKISELTITYVSMSYPVKLVAYLIKNLGLSIEKRDKGIYYINKDRIPMQIVVTSELAEDENLWLKSLSNNLKDTKTVDRLSKEYTKHRKDDRYKAVMNVVVRANRARFEEAKDMCEALKEIWAEDFERARNEGIEVGMEVERNEGIRRMIISCRDFGIASEQVQEKLVENYEVTEKQADEYIRKYW